MFSAHFTVQKLPFSRVSTLSDGKRLLLGSTAI
jgi:hypothetical protein